MPESERPEASDAPSGIPAILRTGALVPLLLLAGITLILVLGFVESQPPPAPHHDEAQAAVPHSPAEFPEVFGKDDSLLGLDGGLDDAGMVAAPKPPFGKNMFPCMDCHGEKDQPPNPTRRELVDKHTNIKLVGHGEGQRWCMDCHDLNDRDSLHLAGGELLPITESTRLCGQCHSDIYRDWKVGIHGKRTGYWNGPKRYLLCVNCHNPHKPHFTPLKPLPSPVRPYFLRATDRPEAPPLLQLADGGMAPESLHRKEESHGK